MSGPTPLSISGAVGDIFGGIGDFMSASGYKKAAAIDTENKALTQEGVNITEFQQGRKNFQTIGAQQAEVAGAGLSAGGTNLNLLRSSMQQGSMAKQQIQVQGDITEANFQEEADAHSAAASSATTAGIGSLLSAPFKFFGL